MSRIETLAREAFPYECCGLLIGVARPDRADAVTRVTRIAESRNLAAPERMDRFEVDPALQFSLMRELRGTGETIVGVYHSHPNGRAAPSPRDREDARDPSLIWLVTAVTGAAPAPASTRAFELTDDLSRFDEIAMRLSVDG